MTSSELAGSPEEARRRASEAAKAADVDFRPCGRLACQEDSFRATLESSRLVACVPWEYRGEPAATGKKKGKKAKKGADGEKSSIPKRGYAVVLDDSVFFPEGGGQPPDTGRIILDDGGVELEVSDAQNVGGVCVLSCPASAREGAAGGDGPSPQLSPPDVALRDALGSGARSVRQALDWDRRFDYMTQHSAQHLLSAVALGEHGMQTLSFSLQRESPVSYIDFSVEPDTGIEDLRNMMLIIEDSANKKIRQNLPMTPRYMDPEDPDFKEKVRSRLLPEGLTGPIRLVEIGDGVDLNTCCGTHVPSLGHLQTIKILRIEKVKGTVLRTHFSAGKRVGEVLDSTYKRQGQITALLSCTEEEQVQRVERLLVEKREREREIKALNEKLSYYQAQDVLRQCKENDNIAVVDLGKGFDMNHMILLSKMTIEGMGDHVKGVLILFVTSNEDDPDDEGAFLLTGDVELVDRVGKNISQTLNGRGGGKNGKFQGKGKSIRSGLQEAKQILENCKKIN